MNDILEKKRINSVERVDQFSANLDGNAELENMDGLGIFVSGSYARNEASIFSDIDLFFVLDGKLQEIDDANLKSMRAFSKVIEIADKMEFPTFSNDGEFLKILEKDEILTELGGRNDDHSNYFTARMLLLLESKPVYGEAVYNKVLKKVIEAYFRDYKHHPRDFKPTFLINDIIRFWKTLCLNYEHKRNQINVTDIQKTKQKIKNLKLKFSRMLTCYGTIAAVIDMGGQAGPKEIMSLRTKTPLERLGSAVKDKPVLEQDFAILAEKYRWFLELTNVSENELGV